MTIREVINAIKNEPSTTGKKSIVETNMSVTLKTIWLDTYGKQKYYVKKINPMGCLFGSIFTIDDNYNVFHEALKRLSSREMTGNDAVEYIEDIISLFVPEDQDILISIVERNLKVGFSIDNFNSVCKILTKFQVALAENLNNVTGVNPIDGTYFASRKCDGTRCVTIINNYEDADGNLVQEVTFKSRQDKEFTTLGNLVPGIKSLTQDLRGTWVLDGECCIVDENGDEHFSWIMQEITRKNHTIANPRYKVFDLLTIEEFEMKEQSSKLSARFETLANMFAGHPHDKIDLLKQERIESQEDFDRWSGYVSEYGWEGFMLRKDTPYQAGRTKDLLKVKKFLDAEYVVEDVVTGKVTYNEGGHKEFDACTALVISHKGNRVEVGSGLSKEQRLRWFEHPDEIIGRTITVQYFEETTNKKDSSISLRFPVLKYVYGDEGRTV